MQRAITVSVGLSFVTLVAAFLLPDVSIAEADGAKATELGDVNGDGQTDIADPISLLAWLFLGGTAPAPCAVSAALPSGLPDTGQTTCYDGGSDGNVVDCTSETCPGQDGFYSTGCPAEGRFIDNEDGTVTDSCTGLMWQRSTGNEGETLSWCEALHYCEDLELAGHDDWRLPNIRELHSLVDYGRLSPSIDPAFDIIATPNLSAYHSSTTFEQSPELLWIIFFTDGDVSRVDKVLARGYALAVRTVESVDGPPNAIENGDANSDGTIDIADAISLLTWLFLGGPAPQPCSAAPGDVAHLPDTGQTTCYDEKGNVVDCASDACPGQDGFYATGCPPEDRFTDNEDGTVTDNCTGLMWQKDDSMGFAWCPALEYSEQLDFANHDDWRLPNARELQSLIDYGRFGPVLDPVFDYTAGFDTWTSTTWRSRNFALAVSFEAEGAQPLDGVISGTRKITTSGRVRAVRNAP